MKRICYHCPEWFLVCYLVGMTLRLSAGVVISEIHYNPPAGDEALEFLEIANDSATPADISGYLFMEGIDFELPAGTLLEGRGMLVICADVNAVRARYGIENAIGNYRGRLDAGGDRVTLADHAGRVVQTLRYRDEGKWPVGPDGTGHTLALKSVYLDSSEPESWSQSLELGGTPGRPNFPGPDASWVETVLLEVGALWRYAKGAQAFSVPADSWREPGFDDSSWLEGPSGIGYGDGDDNTVLSDMQGAYTTVALRGSFQVTADMLDAPGALYLAVDYDDGFCAYLNGNEAARRNAGDPGEDPAWDSVASGVREAGAEESFLIPRSLVLPGENVLAILALNHSLTSTDLSLIPRVVHRREMSQEGGGGATLTINELYRSEEAGGGWIEIYNNGPAAVNLTGYTLTDDPDLPEQHLFTEGTSVPEGGFLVLEDASTVIDFSLPEVRLFLLDPEGLVVTAAVLDRAAPPNWPPGGYSEARYPDGGPLEWVTITPTPGAPNSVDRVMDIVINEIFYHPPRERPGEFIELLNRGSVPVDISGFRFDKGIDFTIEEDTLLGAGEYLVIAEDPGLLQRDHGLAGVQGPWTGRLANDGENVRFVDRAGNTVDEVRYHEGGAWPGWADGDGSSLELIDPDQDNAFGAAWSASDETGKAVWEELAFHVPSYVVATESELHLYLVERGVCHVDDVSITRSGGANLIPNPGFELSTAPWVIQGTHGSSRRVTTDSHTGSASLELSASGKGDTLVNRAEIETSPAMTAGPYDVSLWVRWQRGGSLLVVHGEYTPGPYGGRPSPAVNLSGNSLFKGLPLTVPWNLGTPGAENSARRKWIETTGSGNLGPVLADFEHDPPNPAPGQPVKVAGRVSSAHGLLSVRVHYRAGDASGAFAEVELLDDGLQGDGAAGDGIYGGEIPPFPQEARVVLYIGATDSLGAVGVFPVDAPARTLLYQVHAPGGGALDEGHLVLDAARTSELASRPLHSNELLDGTFVFNNRQVYYNVGIRYRGSPWGRPGQNNYRVKLQDDQPFLHGRTEINLDNSGSSPKEGASLFLLSRNSGSGTPAPTPDYSYVRTWFNGASRGLHGLLQSVDRDFIEEWYGTADRSLALKVEGRKAFTDSGNLRGWDGASFIHRGTDKENYREYFIPTIRRSLDDWSSLIELTRVMDRRVTGSAAFDMEVGSVLDVEAFLRVLAPRILQADWDAFCIGNGHNGYLVLDPGDQRWELLPWDLDHTFENGNVSLFPSADGDVYRLLRRPAQNRLYYRILWEYIHGYWSSSTAGPWLDAVQSATGLGMGGIKGHVDTIAGQVRSTVESHTNADLTFTTNSGQDITTEDTSIGLEGTAPVQIAWIYVVRNDDEPRLLDAVWLSTTLWRVELALPEAENSFELIGIDGEGHIVDTTAMTVRSLAHLPGAFLRGDANADTVIDISDALAMLFHLFHGREIVCGDAADFDDTGMIDVTDAVGLLDYLFRAGSPPPPPFPDRGLDPTPDGTDCS